MMALLLTIIGATVGLALGQGPAFGLMGGILGFLAARLEATRASLTRAERRLDRLEKGAAPDAEAKSWPDWEPASHEAERPLGTPPGPPEAAAEPIQAPAVEPAPEPVPAFEARAAEAPSQTSAQPGLREAVVGFFTGGNIMARVGIIVLFFGVAFLVKYAADHALFPLELRLAAAAAGGLAMVFLGLRIRDKREGFGLALQGGGIGVMYLTAYAAYRLYHLIPPGLTFTLLALLAAGSAFLAVRQNSLALAAFGAIGGFVAPVLASTGQGSHVALFSYYLVLNLGILGVAWFKAWRSLNLLGFLFTFGIGSLWGAQYYTPQHFTTTQPFLLLFFVLYTVIMVLFAYRQAPNLKGRIDGPLVFGTPVVVLALQSALVSGWEYGLAISAAGFGVYYLALAYWLMRRGEQPHRVLGEAFLSIGVVMLTLAVPFAWDAQPTSALWALEGAGIMWVGARQGRPVARWFGAALQALAAIVLVADALSSAASLRLLDGYYLGALIMAVAALFSAYTLRSHRSSISVIEKSSITNGLLLWGVAWWVAGNLSQITAWLPRSTEAGVIIVFLAATLAVALLLARRLDWPELSHAAVGHLPLMWLVFLFMTDQLGHAFAAFGWLAWPLAVAAQYWAMRRREQDGMTAPEELHAGMLWLLAALLTTELSWAVSSGWSGIWEAVIWGLVPSAFVLAVMRLQPYFAWPLARHRDHYLSFGILPLAAGVLAWLVVVNLNASGDPDPLPYWPLLNPLDLSSLFGLFVLGKLLITLRTVERAWAGPVCHHGLRLLGGTAFLWINSALLRALHHGAGLPLRADAIMNSQLAQTSLSILWASLAVSLMLLGSRRPQRQMWLAGAGVMAAAVVKLFLVDLSGTHTMARIVAFLVVGLLLLLVGYHSPAPPRQSQA